MFLWFFVGNTKIADSDRLHEGEPNDFKIVNSYEPSRKDSPASEKLFLLPYETTQWELAEQKKEGISLSQSIFPFN